MMSAEHRRNIAESKKKYAAVHWLGHEIYRRKMGWCVRVFSKDYPQLNDCSGNKRLKGYNHDFKYVRRSYKNWIDAGKEIPAKNEVLFHIDGDSNNDKVENLKVVSRSIMATMSKKHRFFKSKEVNCSNLLLTELENKIRNSPK